jgi:hypothetical protein
VKVAEIVAGCLMTAAGVFSLIKWLRRPYVPGSASEHALYLLHLTARIGVWFAFAALFFGYAFVDDTEAFRWFILVPIALAGVQLLTAVALARSPDEGPTGPGAPGS